MSKHPTCRHCGHEAKPQNRIDMFVGRVFRSKPRCRHSDDGAANASGWPDTCGCGDPIHAR